MSEEESTTPDPFEVGRRALDALNRRDFDAVEGFCAPDAVLHAAETGTFRGARAIRVFLEDFVSLFAELHGEIEEIRDLGNGIFFRIVLLSGRPVGAAKEVRFRYASVSALTGDLFKWSTTYVKIDEARAAAARLAEEFLDREQALRAAGLMD